MRTSLKGGPLFIEENGGKYMSRQNESSKGLVWGLVIALVAVLGLYGGGAYYYSQHFLPRTQVSATKVSNMNLEEADKKVSEKIAGQTIDVKEGDKEVAQLPIDSLGLPIESQTALKKCSMNKINGLGRSPSLQTVNFKVSMLMETWMGQLLIRL